MKKKYILIIVIILLINSFIIIYLFFSRVNELLATNEEDFFIKTEFVGVVTQKYINKEQHNYETVIIVDDTIQHKILFDFVMEGLYEFIEVGDTLSKKSGTLDLRLKRKDLDTLITMKIFDRRKMSRSENE